MLKAAGAHGQLGRPASILSSLSASRLSAFDYATFARPMGLLPTTAHGLGLGFDQAQAACPWNHFFTVRGHSMAAYCAIYDRTGELIFTGSDDRLVKIWSARTGLLLKSCRGAPAGDCGPERVER